MVTIKDLNDGGKVKMISMKRAKALELGLIQEEGGK